MENTLQIISAHVWKYTVENILQSSLQGGPDSMAKMQFYIIPLVGAFPLIFPF